MKFANPGWLYYLVAIPVLYGLFVFDERRRRRQLASMIDPVLWPRIIPDVDPSARLRKATLWSLAAFFAVLALSRPQWGMREEITQSTGVDVMVVLDVSNSMSVEDVTPSRLAKAKHLIGGLMGELRGDRIGVVAFAGSAYVAVPLTTDFGYVREIAEILGPQSVSNQGTDIGAGLETARKSLERGAQDADFSTEKQELSNAIVLITDGEDHEEMAQPVAKELAQGGIRLYVIGVGTSKGGPVPVRDSNGNLTTYKKDRSGQTVVSTFNPDSLVKLAAAGGGQYWTASSTEDEIKNLGLELAGMSRSQFAERRRLVYEERFQIPLGIAVLLLLIELSFPIRKLPRRKRSETSKSDPRPTAAVTASLGLVLSIFPPSASAAPLGAYLENEKGIQSLKDGKAEEARQHFNNAQALDPSTPELEYNQGIAMLKEGNVDGAMDRFRSAAKGALQTDNPELAGKSLFNLGATQAQKGDAQSAARSYLKALEQAQAAENSALEGDTRKNLELLQQQQQQQQQKQQGDQNQDQPEQKDQQKQEQAQEGQDKDKDNKESQAKETKGKRFKSEKLSSDDAERVMAELSSREKELQAKLKKQDGQKGARTPKDW